MLHQQHHKLLELIPQLLGVINIRVEKARCKYDLHKYCFTNQTVNI